MTYKENLPLATTTHEGTIQLTNDFGGTANSPTVIRITGNGSNLTRITSNHFQIDEAVSLTIDQVAKSSGNANSLFISAQDATSGNGGNLVLSSGNGSATKGNVQFKVSSSVVGEFSINKFITSNVGQRFNVKNINLSVYNITATDFILSVLTSNITGNPVTINLPAVPSNGDTYEVKDYTGFSDINNITVNGSPNFIDFTDGYNCTIASPYAGLRFTFDGYASTWLTNPISYSFLGVPDATTSSKGKIQLGGDLNGLGSTAATPKVSGIQGHPITSQTLGSAQNGFLLTWSNPDGYYVAQAPISATFSTRGSIKLAGDLNGTSSTSDSPKVSGIQGNSIAFQTLGASQDGYYLTWSNSDGYLSIKSPTQATSSVVGSIKLARDLGNTALLPQVRGIFGKDIHSSASSPSDLQILQYLSSDGYWAPRSISATTPDADASTKGKLKLANDLSGTADSPTVVALTGNEGDVSIKASNLTFIQAVSPIIGQTIAPTDENGNPFTITAQDSDNTNGGTISISGGSVQGLTDTSGDGGSVQLLAGSAIDGNGGNVIIISGTSTNGNAGAINIYPGNGTSGNVVIESNGAGDGLIYIGASQPSAYVAIGGIPFDSPMADTVTISAINELDIGDSSVLSTLNINSAGLTNISSVDIAADASNSFFIGAASDVPTFGINSPSITFSSATPVSGTVDIAGLITSSNTLYSQGLFNLGGMWSMFFDSINADITLANDYNTGGVAAYNVDTASGAITITLPSSPATDQIVILKDVTGQASTNNITIDANGNTIDGDGTFTISTNYGAVFLHYSTGVWGQLASSGSSGAPQNIYTISDPGSYPYSVLSSDYVILVDTSTTSNTITLPASPTMGQALKIKDKSNNASVNPFTIDGNSINIDNNTSIIINSNYAAIELVFNGIEWNIL